MAICPKFCIPSTNITLRQRLRQLIGKSFGEFGLGIELNNSGKFIRGTILSVGTVFLIFKRTNNKRLRIRISNITDIDLGEVGAPVKIANRLAIVREKSTRTQPIRIIGTIFVKVGKDFVEFISFNPSEGSTIFQREILPCSRIRSIECILQKCTTSSSTAIKRK
ncbi:hypothetical protein [Paenibacillus hamazuiensis]|uniref:hypothetical protein n=1 Tax=Paenibacillus hamazuiensis TaxID=2936508 RepID=UPI00200D4336|nr:hypothetical protein [Paenibacillus hamazuiensis]